MRNFLYWLAIGTALYGCPKANTNTVATNPGKPVEEMVENKYPTQSTENTAGQVENGQPTVKEKVLKKYHVTQPIGTNIYIEILQDKDTGEMSEALYMETFGHERFRLKDTDGVDGPDQVIVFPDNWDLDGRPRIIGKDESEFDYYFDKVASLAIPRNEIIEDQCLPVGHEHSESELIEYTINTQTGPVKRSGIRRSFHSNSVSPYEEISMHVVRDSETGIVHSVSIHSLRIKIESGKEIEEDELFSLEDVDGEPGLDRVVLYGEWDRATRRMKETYIASGEDGFEDYLQKARYIFRETESH